MKKNELLNLKRRLIALSLAGLCTFGLAGCKENNEDINNVENTEIIEEEVKKTQFLVLYDDCAVIIEPERYVGYDSGTYLYFNNDNCIFLSTGQFISFFKTNSYTAEDYVRMINGPEFKIEYIKDEDIVKSLK